MIGATRLCCGTSGKTGATFRNEEGAGIMETGIREPILELLIQTDPEKTVELEGKG